MFKLAKEFLQSIKLQKIYQRFSSFIYYMQYVCITRFSYCNIDQNCLYQLSWH